MEESIDIYKSSGFYCNYKFLGISCILESRWACDWFVCKKNHRCDITKSLDTGHKGHVPSTGSWFTAHGSSQSSYKESYCPLIAMQKMLCVYTMADNLTCTLGSQPACQLCE